MKIVGPSACCGRAINRTEAALPNRNRRTDEGLCFITAFGQARSPELVYRGDQWPILTQNNSGNSLAYSHRSYFAQTGGNSARCGHRQLIGRLIKNNNELRSACRRSADRATIDLYV